MDHPDGHPSNQLLLLFPHFSLNLVSPLSLESNSTFSVTLSRISLALGDFSQRPHTTFLKQIASCVFKSKNNNSS